jgi:hypothetical protein
LALEQSRFFNSTAADPRRYSADNFAEYFRMLFGSGVQSLGNNLAVSPGAIDMKVSVGYGLALVDGYGYWLKDDGTGPWEATLVSAPLPRFASVVLHLDKRFDQQGVRLMVLYGEPATNPQLPPLTRTSAITELSLARIYIPAGAVQITEGNVVDERNDDELCGRIALRVDGGIMEEADPTVPAWAKQPDKPAYTANEVGVALPLGVQDGGHGGTTLSAAQNNLDIVRRTISTGYGNGADPNYWRNAISGYTYWNSNNTITNMPSGWGVATVLHNGGDFTVIYHVQSTGAIYRASGNASTSVCEWRQLHDSESNNVSPRLRLTASDDVSPTSTNHALQIGNTSTYNIAIDGNEIMARRNGAVSELYLNDEGGAVYINNHLAYHAGILTFQTS